MFAPPPPAKISSVAKSNALLSSLISKKQSAGLVIKQKITKSEPKTEKTKTDLKQKLIENIDKGKVQNSGLPEIMKSLCFHCLNPNVVLTKLPKEPFKDAMNCKLCGVPLNGAKYARCCSSCKANSITCVNCIPCPEGH
jgi:hypothetical protein